MRHSGRDETAQESQRAFDAFQRGPDACTFTHIGRVVQNESGFSVLVFERQAILSAADAVFSGTNRPRLSRLKLRVLTALLHLLQPLARLSGRVRHGLTAFRVRGRR